MIGWFSTAVIGTFWSLLFWRPQCWARYQVRIHCCLSPYFKGLSEQLCHLIPTTRHMCCNFSQNSSTWRRLAVWTWNLMIHIKWQRNIMGKTIIPYKNCVHHLMNKQKKIVMLQIQILCFRSRKCFWRLSKIYFFSILDTTFVCTTSILFLLWLVLLGGKHSLPVSSAFFSSFIET